MKRFVAGILIFIGITVLFGLQGNLEIAMNITGIIGVGGVLVAGFYKTGFSSPSAPALGNLSVIRLDKKINLSNTLFLIAIPNLIGSVLLYFLH
ncbi:hypothetical protein [Planococcus lenghuensis]|uniref:DUF5316 domain-containing protein n=1 Tax=Planococcus lenghuensis TaxID=2213202 RepID=A0A1Q2KYD7_9BACL|nr:hypothetical protein [Planococcus lenghuensis]AQQ53146.1 hypothetical protein B0X71_08610 [Planococcus lenghuensis]